MTEMALARIGRAKGHASAPMLKASPDSPDVATPTFNTSAVRDFLAHTEARLHILASESLDDVDECAVAVSFIEPALDACVLVATREEAVAIEQALGVFGAPSDSPSCVCFGTSTVAIAVWGNPENYNHGRVLIVAASLRDQQEQINVAEANRFDSRRVILMHQRLFRLFVD